jgi:hypothetical protein
LFGAFFGAFPARSISMASSYSFSGSRMNPVVMKGKIKGFSAVSVDYGGDAVDTRGGGDRKLSRDIRFDLAFKTLLDQARFRLHAQMQTQTFEVGSPDGKPGTIWDLPGIWLWATDLELPTGYDMWATPTPRRASEVRKGPNTYPEVSIDLLVEVGPMIGTWSKYKYTLWLDPVAGRITM